MERQSNPICGSTSELRRASYKIAVDNLIRCAILPHTDARKCVVSDAISVEQLVKCLKENFSLEFEIENDGYRRVTRFNVRLCGPDGETVLSASDYIPMDGD